MAIKESSPKFLGSLKAARRFQPLNFHGVNFML
jgi:hypothetical protein